MKKRILYTVLLVFLLCLSGCNQGTISPQPKRNENGHYVLYYFYIETCHNCQAFEKNITPLLEEEFGDDLEIIKFDLNSLATVYPYEKVLEQLETEVSDDDYAQAPTVAFDGAFMKVGIAEGQEPQLVEDMVRAINGEKLSGELEASRYLYKE